MKLSDRIRLARKAKGWSQSRLAKELSITTGTVGHWERSPGHAPATFRMELLAVVLDVNFEWLTTGRGPMKVNGHSQRDVDLPVPLTPDEEQLLVWFRRQPSRVQAAFTEYLKLITPRAN